MNDTPPHVEEMLRERMMARSGEERFIMACQMFTVARDMILASLPPDLPPAERKRRLFERVYGYPPPPDMIIR